MNNRKNYDRIRNISIPERRKVIEDWVDSAQDRRIMIMAEVDYIPFDKIAEAENLSTKTVSRRVHKWENMIFRHV